MAKPFRDEAEIYTYILNAKSSILSLASTVEHQLELIIASHFSITDKDYDLFCKMLYPNSIGLTFGIKIGLYEILLKSEEPKYLVQNPDFIKSIRRIKELRNHFAHAMNQPKKALKNFVGKKHFELDYLVEGRMLTRQFTIDDIKNRYDELNNIVNELQEFNIRDEKRKKVKITKIKLKKP